MKFLSANFSRSHAHRCVFLSLLGIVISLCTTLYAAPPAEAGPWTHQGAILYLQKETVDLDYYEEPLEEILQDVRELSGLNVFVQWNTLAGIGILPDSLITVTAQEVSLGRALEIVLDQAGPGLAELQAGYEVADDGVVEVGIAESSYGYELQTYYVADMTEPASGTAGGGGQNAGGAGQNRGGGGQAAGGSRFTNSSYGSSRGGSSSGMRSGGGGGRGGGGGGAGGRGGQGGGGTQIERELNGEELIWLIRSTIKPYSWNWNAGGGGGQGGQGQRR